MTTIYAHRGASKQAPENTMPAFDLAYHYGADGVETDVQLTKDNVPVLIHDENVRRTTNGVGFVQDYTYNELKKLDAGSWFHPSFKGTPIPTLDELLTWNQEKKMKLNIELKNNLIDYKNLEQIVCDKIIAYDMIDKIVISTFNDKCLHRLHQLPYDISYAFLTSKKRKDLIRFAKQQGAKGLHLRYRLLNKRLLENTNRESLYVAVYTVNQPISLARVFKINCQAVFTDVPNIAIRIRQKIQD
ncbi:glycerophosphodiester phosphodiesterase [Gracilibacillus sp. YIM 98692]|uniref:glycerophosphodiester phosphodiesterase n=1 Tax=Gracilibacillus sp. YIM 98692 TaxID=2663532 RepID=UPI003204D890